MIEHAGYVSPEGQARLDKYGSTLSHDNVRLLIKRIEDYPEIIAAVRSATPASSDLRERVAAVLGEHRRNKGACTCGYEYGAGRDAYRRHAAHVADAMLGVLADHDRRVAERALWEAADEWPIGVCAHRCFRTDEHIAPKDCLHGPTWLEQRADHLAAHEGNPGSHEGQGSDERRT